MRTLQDILADISFADLPPAWQDFDLQRFSANKQLWDYQQEALQYALKALWKYYEDFADYHPSEPEAQNARRKEQFWQWYRDNGLDEELDLRVENQRRDVRELLMRYYPAEDGCISYRRLINRVGFWMATGSGKSLVLVKLIELLWRLMQRNEIPPYPMLILTARDDLIEQFQAHVQEFNNLRSDFQIVLSDLRAFPDRQHILLPIVGDSEITVFFYRADNLSDEQKERLIDFRNYENGGRWYVLLDEAHKGDKQDSKRQHLYSIMSRNGFLFNFSATFTDKRDIVTTVYNFNLSEFVRAGYGKHITILKQENRAFKDKEDYTGSEKQRMVLKALLMLAYVRKVQETLPDGQRAYHRPLMLVLVNSVNTNDADLKLFFRELERIGRGDMEDSVWHRAKRELWQELKQGVEWIFERTQFTVDGAIWGELRQSDILRLVYNAASPGSIEVIVRPSNRQEMAFKLKTAEQPFALIKIGDISDWLKEELEGYEVLERVEEESFFQQLNEEHSPINLLMGSRAFYEGWDSNRPNVITYINIGTGTEARKFILQSVGRGVRTEPLPGHRQRLQTLYNAGRIDRETFVALRDKAHTLETLFIFGTNRNALQTVIEQLDQEKRRKAEHEIALEVSKEAIHGRRLLIPVYRLSGTTLVGHRLVANPPTPQTLSPLSKGGEGGGEGGFIRSPLPEGVGEGGFIRSPLPESVGEGGFIRSPLPEGVGEGGLAFSTLSCRRGEEFGLSAGGYPPTPQTLSPLTKGGEGVGEGGFTPDTPSAGKANIGKGGSRPPRKFEIAPDELEKLQRYVEWLGDDRLIVCRHNATPQEAALLRQCLQTPQTYFNTSNGRRYGKIDLLLSRLFAYFKVIPQEADGLKTLEDEIRHFRHIKVFLQDISMLKQKVEQVREAPEHVKEMRAKYEARELTLDEIIERAKSIRSDEAFFANGATLHIKRLAQHYYVPVILSDRENIDWIRHIIRHPSEVAFLNRLEKHLEQDGNCFQSLDWWAFSKIDESVDEVYIPYYDPQSNRIRRFLPDFVFWLQKGANYAIVFVDPKGTQHTDYQYKVDGFCELFHEANGQPKIFSYKGLNVRVYLMLYTQDANQAPKSYSEHWFDDPCAIAQRLVRD